MKKSPCYNNGQACPKRKGGCHSTCKDYKEWLAERNEQVEKIREAKHHERVMRDQAIRRTEKLKKGRWRK